MINKNYLAALSLLCLLPNTTRAFTFYEIIPYGALTGAVLALITTNADDEGYVERHLGNAAAGAIAGGVLTAVGGAVAKTLGCFPSEEQKHLMRLESAECVYNDAQTFVHNTTLDTRISTRNGLHQHYNALLNKKVITSKYCRRLFHTKTLSEQVRYNLQERYDNLHAKIADLAASYKARLDEMYASTDWQNTTSQQTYRSKPNNALATYRLLQRANAPRVTMRVGVRQVIR